MEDWQNLMRARGHKITPQRMVIMEVLEQAGRCLTAEEIAVMAQDLQPSLSKATVYRNLEIMCSLGLAKGDQFGPRGRLYRLHKVSQEDHHHLICLGCGKTYEIEHCPLKGVLSRLEEEKGFAVRDHYLEIRGYCASCLRSLGEENLKNGADRGGMNY